MASRSAMRTGATSANSTAACPFSARRPMRRRRVMTSDRRWWAPSDEAHHRLDVLLPIPLQLADEGRECGLDLRAERHEKRDDDGCDERQNDAVLGHSLAFLTLDVVLHPVEQERSEHFIHLGIRG